MWKDDGLFDPDDPSIIQITNVDGDSTDDDSVGESGTTANEADIDYDDEDAAQEYYDFVSQFLEVQVDDPSERVERDGAIYLNEDCEVQNINYGIETEMAQYMNSNPNRYATDPFRVVRTMNADVLANNQQGG